MNGQSWVAEVRGVCQPHLDELTVGRELFSEEDWGVVLTKRGDLQTGK